MSTSCIKSMLVWSSTMLFPVIALAQGHMGSQVAIGRPSPHTEKPDCQVCHVESENTLLNWVPFVSTKKKLKFDKNEVCQQCHGVEFGHGIGLAPKTHGVLPLDENGLVACAITCHDMHVTSDNPLQKRYHLRLPYSNLCLSCHKT